MKKSFIFTSNMFPSSTDSSFGAFVRHSLEDLLADFKLDGIYVVTERSRSIRKLGQYVATAARLATALLKGRVDFVYAHYLTHLTWVLLPFLHRIPIVVNAHGYDLIPNSAYQRVLVAANRHLLSHAALIVVPSEYYRDRLLELHRGVDPGKVHVNYSCGVDRRRFHPLATRKTCDFLYVSRIDAGKGWDLLLAAVRELRLQYPGIRVVAWGHGADADAFRNALERHRMSPHLQYYGAAVPDEIPELMSSARYLVFPTARESLGLVAIEALSCGVPVVTFDSRPMNDIVQHMHNGLIFRDYNAKALAEAMRMALDLNAGTYSELSRSATESTIKYCRQRLARDLNARIRELP